jgi:hypothetical protein
MNEQEWKLVDRLKEPSSWAAIAAAFAAFGITIPNDWVHAISLVGAGLASILGIVLKEKSV